MNFAKHLSSSIVTTLAALLLLPLCAGTIRAQSKPAPASEQHVSQLLAEIKKKDKGQLAVSEEDGRFMRLMIATSGAKRALEIGGASGYSAIWIGMGLRATGGRLVTIEYDPVRAQETDPFASFLSPSRSSTRSIFTRCGPPLSSSFCTKLLPVL